MHFLSMLTYLWCRLTEIEATESLTPTYLPLCDVQISHLSSKLAQPPQNSCWHDNSEEWNESSRDTSKVEQTKHEGTSVFSTGTHSSTSIDTPKQVSNHDMFCSVHAEERVPAGGGGGVFQTSTWRPGVCSSTMTGRWGGPEPWCWMAGLGPEPTGSPTADPLIECWCWGTALDRGTRPPARQRGLATFSRGRFPVNKCCYSMHHSVNITRKTPPLCTLLIKCKSK